MTTILIIIIWVGYGLFALYQTKATYKNTHPRHGKTTNFLEIYDEDGCKETNYVILWRCTYILFAPIIFLIKCLYGAFKRYE